jgi:nuclear pore complex protein Nup205
MAQTRPGAERLLEARIFPVLSQCEFLDTRPEADQSFMGMLTLSLRGISRAELFYEDQDSFLPSAIQRYHQLFMPALQLVAAMLTTLGAQHATASSQVRLISDLSSGWALTLTCHQALDFLSSHRETIIILLKNDSEEIGLSIVQEIHLVVSLSRSVLTLVPKSELVGFRLLARAIR